MRTIMHALAAALALAAATLPAPDRAAAVTYAITGTVTFTDQLGPGAPDVTGTVGTGTVSFKSRLITGSGRETVSGPKLKVSFTLFGQTFSGADDQDVPLYPKLRLKDGKPKVLDFAVSEIGFNPTDILAPDIQAFFTRTDVKLVRLGRRQYGAELMAVTTEPAPPPGAAPPAAVPLPAALPLAAGGPALLALLALLARRRRA